ncbi:MAG: hypothetical protein R6U17_01520 [Thermoplasmata archaeon]
MDEIVITHDYYPVIMCEKEPSMQEWEALYDAAEQFKEEECWDHMSDDDIFGVKDIETGEIGYCCIMGAGGEHFALAVYRGSKGLDGLLKLRYGEVDPNNTGVLHMNDCLMASFEDRKYLDERDRKIIKKLGLKFRGRNAWPLFRDYKPGYHPWFLNSKDVRSLTTALKQSIEVCKKIKEDPELLYLEEGYLVRVPHKEGDGIVWKDERIEPEQCVSDVKSTDIQIHDERLEKINKEYRGTWEIGAFRNPEGVQEDSKRPYYPKTIVYVEQDSGMILSFFICKSEDYHEDIVDHFISVLEQSDVLPQNIVATDEEVLNLMYPITEKMCIMLFRSDHLEMVDEVKDHMFNFYR